MTEFENYWKFWKSWWECEFWGLGLLLGWNRLTKLDDFENFDEGQNSIDFVKWFDGEKQEGEKQDDYVNWEESVK